jgi:Zn-dependent protease
MNNTITILSVAGIPIRIHASWLAIYALITWTLAIGYFPRVLPDGSATTYWISGLIAALLLFVSVLLHELSHSFVALAHGLAVRSITLHVFGGVSHLEDEPATPRAEFLIAIVGPLTSFAIGGLLWTLTPLGLVPDGTAAAIVGYLVFVNVAVGIFNLIPGFPLDGGRILRAAVWKWKGSLSGATYTASRVGTAFAFVLMGLGLLQILSGEVVGGFWFILIGLFLRSAADASYSQIALREALGRVPVRSVMTRNVVSTRPDTSVAELVDLFWQHHFTSFPVVDGDRVAGLVALQGIHAVDRERWPHTRVREVMRPLDDTLSVTASDSAHAAFSKATTNGIGRLAVVDGSRLVGYLSLKDLTHVLALQGVGGVKRRAGKVDEAPPIRRAA